MTKRLSHLINPSKPADFSKVSRVRMRFEIEVLVSGVHASDKPGEIRDRALHTTLPSGVEAICTAVTKLANDTGGTISTENGEIEMTNCGSATVRFFVIVTLYTGEPT